MKEKQFKITRIIIAAILSAIVGTSIIHGNTTLPIIAVITAVAIMHILKRQVTDVLVDERIEKVAGKAAQKTLTIWATAMAAISVLLIAYKDVLPQYTQTAYALSYSTCGLLLLYSALYHHLYGKPDEDPDKRIQG
ncbi:Uncharacterised protein [uncultured archaeon]|nr:Uncharacterised protein [uncultured archaeon]